MFSTLHQLKVQEWTKPRSAAKLQTNFNDEKIYSGETHASKNVCFPGTELICDNETISQFLNWVFGSTVVNQKKVIHYTYTVSTKTQDRLDINRLKALFTELYMLISKSNLWSDFCF